MVRGEARRINRIHKVMDTSLVVILIACCYTIAVDVLKLI